MKINPFAPAAIKELIDVCTYDKKEIFDAIDREMKANPDCKITMQQLIEKYNIKSVSQKNSGDK